MPIQSARPKPALHFGSLSATAAVLCLSAVSAMALVAGPAADIQAKYEQDRAKCLSGASNQPRATCLQEAGAARDAAKRGQLEDTDPKYHRNALDRCKALTGDEARDCVARINGKGTTSGSAPEGGIYRELITREVKPADAPMPAPAASAP